MNLLLEILILMYLIKIMDLNGIMIFGLYVVCKILGQVYIMWEEGIRQVFLVHYKKKAKKR